MLVVVVATGQRSGEQMLGENHSRARTVAVRSMAALADAIETIAGSHDPCIRRGTLQILAEVLEYRRVFRRERRKVVDRFVDARRQARRRDVVPQNSAIDYLREKRRLRNKISHQARDILLPLRRERLLIARPAAESNDDYFPLP